MTDWYDSGAGLYRQEELFKMCWPADLDLQHHTIAAAPFGGPIALLRDAAKIYVLRSDEDTEAYLTFYTAAGGLMRRYKWDYEAALISMAWVSFGELACVLQNGLVLIFSLSDAAPVQVQLRVPNPRGSLQLAACHFSNRSAIFQTTGTNDLYAVTNVAEKSSEPAVPLASLRTAAGVNISSIVCRSNTEKDVKAGAAKSVVPEALVALSDGTLFAVSTELVEEMPLKSTASMPVVDMALGADENILACFTKRGHLHIFDVVTKTCLYVIDTSIQKPPNQLIWCGMRALVLHWDTLGTYFVSVAKQTITRLEFRPLTPVHLVEEIDSTRVIANEWSDVLEPVHPGLIEVRRPGSTAPVTLLYDAREAFDNGDADAESNMQQLQADGTLDDAVKQCCLVAAAEFDPEAQKTFLRAASYGKSFCKGVYASELTDDFRNAHCKLQILNNLRSPAVGIPLTSAQYDRLTPATIVQRLCACKRHFLAAKICKLLGMSNAKVLSHWAYMKMATTNTEGAGSGPGRVVSNHELSTVIHRVFKTNNAAVSYASVARQAYELGKRDLAIMLLHHETKVDEKVGLLLMMNDFGRALQVAVQSHNSDHLFAVLMHMRKAVPDGSLFTRDILDAYPDARDLLVLFLQQQQRLHASDGGFLEFDRLLLQRIYNEMSDSVRAGCSRVLEATAMKDFDGKMQALNDAVQNHFNVAAQVSRDKFFADAVRMQRRLLHKQRELVHSSKFKTQSKRLLAHSDSITVQNFVGSSLGDTIHTCIVMDMMDTANQLQREFKVPDKRYWNLVVSALGKIGDWNGLWKFSNTGKSPPIGFRPFALVCIQGNAPAQAAKFISRVKDDRQQIDLYLQIQRYREAVQTALRRREHYDRLPEILRACDNYDEQQELRAIIHRAGLQI